jgi:hypothetical protein
VTLEGTAIIGQDVIDESPRASGLDRTWVVKCSPSGMINNPRGIVKPCWIELLQSAHSPERFEGRSTSSPSLSISVRSFFLFTRAMCLLHNQNLPFSSGSFVMCLNTSKKDTTSNNMFCEHFDFNSAPRPRCDLHRAEITVALAAVRGTNLEAGPYAA